MMPAKTNSLMTASTFGRVFFTFSFEKKLSLSFFIILPLHKTNKAPLNKSGALSELDFWLQGWDSNPQPIG